MKANSKRKVFGDGNKYIIDLYRRKAKEAQPLLHLNY